MNYKFLPLAIGMALASTVANAESFEELTVDGATTLKGNVAIGSTSTSNSRLLDISIPKGEDPNYIIYSSDLNLATNRGIFEVTNKGELRCQDWTVTEKNVGAQYNGRLQCTYNKDEDGFNFSTHGYNRIYPISFNANKFTFNGGGLEVQKETILDSTLQVKDNATFSKNVKVWGETNLSTLNIEIPYTTDKSGQKTRSYDYLIYGSDADQRLSAA